VHWFVDDALRSTALQPPLGRPLSDRMVALVDEHGNEVADGAVGEIVVADRFLALGYWQDAELTARAFATDPATPGRRIYKTGDLASRRPDGLIEYVGRKDQRIKLNGQRVELGEVESALASCRGIRDAVVLVRRNASDGTPQSLAAFCEVEREASGLSPRHVGAMLAKILPRFMVPRSITIVDALPRLSNFKIDREELYRRDRLKRERAGLTEPRTKIEETLLALWREVLKRQDIGCDDDFFQCGGDSLSAVDLIHRIEKELQYQLPLAILAEAPTVSDLEVRLETRTLGPVDNMIRIHTAGRNRPLFAVCGLFGHALRLFPVLRSLGSDQPCYALQPPGMDWTSVGCTTLPEIAAYYISQVKTVQPSGPYRLFGASFGGLVVFEMALQLQRAGDSIECLIMADTYPPKCLVSGIADVWQSNLNRIRDTRPRQTHSIEALNLRVAKTHLRMIGDYVLDSRSDQCVFRGELTYLYNTGNPIVSGHDRRRLWQQFAPRLRLLQLPGIHGTFDREPQYSALQSHLRSCLNGEAVTTSDPATVYDRSYRIETRDRDEELLSSTGEVYRVEQDRSRGHLEEVRTDTDGINFLGWAVEPFQREPAQVIAIFLDGRFLGYGACGVSRPDVAKHLDAASAQYAGFNFHFPRIVAGRPRLFALSSNGIAAELRTSIDAVTIGTVVKFSNTEPLRVILDGSWSQREAWGLWSDGPRAAVIFDASSLPDCFTVAIEANFFPSRPPPVQKVRISDGNGHLLTTISNERPNGDFAVRLDRSSAQSRKWASLIFDIDVPTSPQDLGSSADSRTLGIGLVALAFR